MNVNTQTVNGLLADKLATTHSNTNANITGSHFQNNSDYGTDFTVVQRHSSGGEVGLGASIASVAKPDDGVAYTVSATWAAPNTTMVATDAIKVMANLRVEAGNPVVASQNFITEQLGATKLSSATWTIQRYMISNGDGSPTNGWLYWGDTGHNSLISNFQFTTGVGAAATAFGPRILGERGLVI